MKIQRIAVTSSQVASLGHDPETSTLHVEFKPFKKDQPNPVYEYRNVTPEIYQAIITGESIGREINQRLKKFPDRHPYRRLTDEESAQS